MRLCEVQVSYRPKYENANHPVIRSSSDIEKLRWQMFSEDTICYREEFVVVFLNKANRVLGLTKMFSGGISSTVVDVKMIAQQALLANASSVVLAHNHPSGSLIPSMQDDTLTRRIKDSLALFDIRVLDHVIMTLDGKYSYSDEGRL